MFSTRRLSLLKVTLPLVAMSATCHRVEEPAPVSLAPTAPLDAVHARVAALVNRVESAPKLAGVNRQERVHDEVRAAVLEPWRQAWTARDAAAFERLLASPEASLAWAASPRTLRRERAGIREYTWGLAAGTAGAAAYLAQLRRVDEVRLDVTRLTVSDDAASPTATATLHFELRALDAQGARRHDRGTLTVDLSRTRAGWRIARTAAVGCESLEAIAGRQTAFEDATAATGLDRVPVADRSEAIRRGGYALVAADFDSDGRPDLLVGNSGPVRLYRNTEAGFVDVTERMGLRGETLVKSAALVDLDNDGDRDLVMLRFVDTTPTAAAQDVFNGRVGDGDLLFYENAGARFERRAQVLTRSHHYDRAMPLAVADFNADGHLDLYIGFPGARDFTNNLAHGPQRDSLAHQGLWLNHGNWDFREQAGENALSDARGLFPHAALATDLDRDGHQDLVVVDDSGRINPVYRNTGGAQFVDMTAHLGLSTTGWGMGAASGDYDGDGRIDLAMTVVGFSAYRRVAAGLGEDPTRDESRGIFLLHQRADGRFDEVAIPAGIGDSGDAAAGTAWIDYNADGNLDLYVTNGLWSGGAEDIVSLFARASILREDQNGMVADTAMSGLDDADPNPLLSMLRGFRGSLQSVARGPFADRPTLSAAGYQRNRLFRNNGDGSFTEVGYLEGADRIEDGYVIAAADFDGDGRQDLALRNTDPPLMRPYAPVVLLRNVSAPPALTVSLVGAASNRDGVGAMVTAEVQGRTLVREVAGPAGASQGDAVAYFGLGGASGVTSLEVRWPSGQVERLGPSPAARVVVREGAGYQTAR